MSYVGLYNIYSIFIYLLFSYLYITNIIINIFFLGKKNPTIKIEQRRRINPS